jgi:hypothetical protein
MLRMHLGSLEESQRIGVGKIKDERRKDKG